MRFFERNGIVPIKQIQISDVDKGTRNRVINFFSNQSDSMAAFALDRLGNK